MTELELCIRRIHGELSEEEEIQFQDWLQASEANRKLFTSMQALQNQGSAIETLTTINVEAAWKKVAKDSPGKERPLYEKFEFSWLRYAAVFLVLVGASYLGYQSFFTSSSEEIAINTDRILLTLGDGTIREIDPEKEGIITTKQGQAVRVQQQSLHYESAENAAITYNTLQVPYGKKFTIVLADGTIVHLNAGTSLTYPTAFANNAPRSIELQGEAFFEVSKKGDYMPFVVNTNALRVRVLGTHFNVSAYPGDQQQFVVLQEGSVAVYQPEESFDAKTRRIKPGEKAAISHKQIAVQTVNIKKYLTWIKGGFALNNDSFSEALKKIERQYNVTIQNDFSSLAGRHFNGSFGQETIGETLDAFKEITGFEYVIKDGIIIITSH